MKVLFVPSWYPSEWAPIRGIFFQEQAQFLSRQGLEIGVVYPEYRTLKQLSPKTLLYQNGRKVVGTESGIKIIRYRGWNIPIEWLFQRVWVSQAVRLIGEYVRLYGRPDIIHAQSAIWAGVAAWVAGRRLGIPYIVQEHLSSYQRGAIQPWKARLIEQALHGANAVVGVSQAMAEHLEPYTGQPVQVIPNMIDTSFFTPPTSRINETFTFLNVSRLDANKGVDILIRAFAKAFETEQQVRLRIVGDGNLRQHLEDLVLSLGVGDKVVFSGSLGREELLRAYQDSMALVLSSYHETFGLVLIEAMSTGIPVIASRCGGPEDIVQDSLGTLFTPGNVDELAAQMRALCKNVRTYSPSTIRDYVVSNFDQHVVCQRLSRLYQDVIGQI